MAGEQSRVTTIVSLVTHVDLLPPSRATPRRRIVQGKPAWDPPGSGPLAPVLLALPVPATNLEYSTRENYFFCQRA